MSAQNLTETVRALVADELDIEPTFNLMDSFYSLGADSLERTSLLLALEEALGIEIPERLSTPQQVIDYAWSQMTTPA